MSEYAQVPVEPTDKMVTAGVTALSMVSHSGLRQYTNEEKIRYVWPMMVQAALLENDDQGRGADARALISLPCLNRRLIGQAFP